jgi:anti-sigma B factor antagonist
MIDIVNEEEKYLVAQVSLTEANLSNAEQFKNKLIDLLNITRRTILLDLQQVGYVDSSFLGALVAALKHAISLQFDIVLLNPQTDIADLLKLIRLDKVFKIYPTAQEAVQDMGYQA